ncbi:MAG: zinc ribbon domain-containing protein [Chloroflexi bacterium]|nr:zinc ribbon domain-containing protein [Chloroflexota bacterium]
MPIYEYRCEECAKLSSILVRSPKSAAAPVCQHCGGTRLKKVMSRVVRLRTHGDVTQEYGIPRPGEPYSDPRQIGTWVERRFESYGMEVPEETRRMIDAARDGELPGPAGDL